MPNYRDSWEMPFAMCPGSKGSGFEWRASKSVSHQPELFPPCLHALQRTEVLTLLGCTQPLPWVTLIYLKHSWKLPCFQEFFILNYIFPIYFHNDFGDMPPNTNTSPIYELLYLHQTAPNFVNAIWFLSPKLYCMAVKYTIGFYVCIQSSIN